MLTPDVGRLDRRIAQEAATLAASGWEVEIHPSMDPGLTYDGELASGVRFLPREQPAASGSSVKGALRTLRGRVARSSGLAAQAMELVLARLGHDPSAA